MRHSIYTIAILFLSFLLVGSATFIVSPLLPAIMASLHRSEAGGGLLVSTYAACYVIFIFILVPISDRVSRKLLLVTGMIVFAVGLLFCGLAGTFMALLFARAVAGAGAAIISPSIWAYIGDAFSPERRSRVTALVASALSIGLIFGVPAGSALSAVFGWRLCFISMGTCTCLLAACLAFLPQVMPIQHPAQAGRWRALFKTNDDVCYAISFLSNFSLFGLYTCLGVALQHLGHLSAAQTGGVFMLAGCGNLAGVLLAGSFREQHLLRKRLVYVASTLCLAFLATALTVHILPLLIAATVGWMAAGGALFAMTQTLVTQLECQHRGAVGAINNGAMWAGTASGAALIGALASEWGLAAASVLCGCLALVIILLARRLRFVQSASNN
ncbi:MAG: MFS transporter [Sporolactobacillus sp.]